jgi:MFS family permease
LSQRVLVTVAVMAATVMQVLDTTIVNVALPQMQGELGATSDQISWVLTSYLVASAICMPLTGYLTDKLGRRRYLLLSISGFVLASMLCGVALNLASWWCSACCKACSALRWCPCRRPSWWTTTRANSAARPWPSGAWG